MVTAIDPEYPTSSEQIEGVEDVGPIADDSGPTSFLDRARELSKRAAEKVRALRRLFEADEATIPIDVKRKWRRHFRKRPFDLLRWGLLKIQTKYGFRWFVLNEEQETQLNYIEREWYARRPVRIIVLKARQIGETTFIVGCLFALCMTHSDTNTHFVSDRSDKAEGQQLMFNRFYENMPVWCRPSERSKKPITFDDRAKDKVRRSSEDDCGVYETTCRIESAESRDNISRGFTFHFNNFSELAFWPQNSLEEIASALINAVPDDFPSFVAEESTGKTANDLFYDRYFMAKNGELPGYKSFFFPWFAHREYRRPLDVPLEEFMASLAPEDEALMKAYSLEPEQINWYVRKRATQMGTRKGFSLDLFRRENPSCEEECFLGTGSNLFTPEKIKADRMRCEAMRPVLSLEQLPISSSCYGVDVTQRKYVRCELVTDEQRKFRQPQLITSPLGGTWTIYERARVGHRYVIAIDPAEGKVLQKGSMDRDDTSIGVWRITFDTANEPAKFVQVAQMVRQDIRPSQTAKEAWAMSKLYPDWDGEPAIVVVERNNDGKTVIDKGKELGVRWYYQRDLEGRYGLNQHEDLIGIVTTGGKEADGAKSVLVNGLIEAWLLGHIQFNSLLSCIQCGLYVKNDKGQYKGLGANHDDTVSEAFLMLEGVKYCLDGRCAPVPARRRMAMTVEEEPDTPTPPKVVFPDYHNRRQKRKIGYGI